MAAIPGSFLFGICDFCGQHPGSIQFLGKAMCEKCKEKVYERIQLILKLE